MAKTITLEFEKEKYTLELDRSAVKYLEDQGFIADDITKKPVTMIPMLFYAAFKKHNTGIKRKTVEAIYEDLQDKDSLVSALIEMYIEPVEAMFDSNVEGNATWGKSW